MDPNDITVYKSPFKKSVLEEIMMVDILFVTYLTIYTIY
jgi:hypothetical protein